MAKTQFFDLVSPEDARATLLPRVTRIAGTETVPTREAVGRVLAEDITSPLTLPAFRRSTVDGFAVRAKDTYGASDALPVYLTVIGEVPMGTISALEVDPTQTAEVHTGGMVPEGADAVVMIENTQPSSDGEIEVRRAAAPGENVINIGEDITEGDAIAQAGHILRPQDMGGLMAVGITEVEVVRRPRVAIFSSGDEVIPPEQTPEPGQVRDINSTTLATIVERAGGIAVMGGILPDDFDVMFERVKAAYDDGADMVVLSAGSSVSVRDNTAEVLNGLGEPGVLVHGIATKPGKPTILGMAGRVPVIGLPGNPISALVQFTMVGLPALYRLMGAELPLALQARARLLANVASVAGREDYVPTTLRMEGGELVADPIFFKSNLIFKLVQADGLIKVPLDKTGLEAGDSVEVRVF